SWRRRQRESAAIAESGAGARGACPASADREIADIGHDLLPTVREGVVHERPDLAARLGPGVEVEGARDRVAAGLHVVGGGEHTLRRIIGFDLALLDALEVGGPAVTD